MARRALGVDAAIRDELRKLHTTVHGEWSLPIVFTREGDTLKAEMIMGLEIDLTTFSRADAERTAHLMFKNALLRHMGRP